MSAKTPPAQVLDRGLGIRDAGADDLKALTALWVEAWQATMPDIDFVARRGWFADNFRTRTAAGARTLVAFGADGLAGFVMIDPASGELDQIAVAPRWHGGGIAARLIHAAKAAAPRGIDLTVNTENARAIAFYLREGFTLGAEGTNPNSGRPIRAMHWRPGGETAMARDRVDPMPRD